MKAFKTNLGCSFVTAYGELVECYQMIGKDNTALAVADFRNGKLERFDCAASCIEQGDEWLKAVKEHALSPLERRKELAWLNE